MIDGTESDGSAVKEKSLERTAITNASHPVRRYSFPKRVPEYQQPPRMDSELHMPHSKVHSVRGNWFIMLAIITRVYTTKDGSENIHCMMSM